MLDRILNIEQWSPSKKLLVPLLLFIGLFSSCVEDETGGLSPNSDKDPMVTFSLKVPKVSTPNPTRSLSIDDESLVSTIDVLVFEEDGNFKYVRVGEQKGSPLQKGDNVHINFEISLPEGTYDLVFVANGRGIIDDAKSGDFLIKGATKEVALGALKKSLPAGVKWEANEIPMWGYIYNIDIDENTKLVDKNSIAMARMLAKIEVELSTGAAGIDNDNFSIKELVLYNYNTEGNLVPDMSNGGWDGANDVALKPNVPANKKELNGFLGYTSADDKSGEYFTPSRVTNTIYTFEAEAGSANSMSENTCLVIGGSYRGGATSYYRVDFVDRQNSTKFLDLMRNHRYSFLVSAITGEGFSTHKEAFEAGPVHIEANLLQWDIGEMGNVVFDDQNFLAVNPPEVEYDRDGAIGETISVKTDYLLGDAEYSLSGSMTDPNVPLEDSWLKLSNVVDKSKIVVSGYDAFEYLLTYDATVNTTSETRVAYIHIKVGRLVNVAKITQTNVANLSVRFQRKNSMGNWEDVNTIYFAQSEVGESPKEEKLRVVWSPRTHNLTLTPSGATDNNNEIIWETNPYDEDRDYILNDETGVKEFTIRPKSITQYERSSFTIADAKFTGSVDTGTEMVGRGIDIKQFVEDIWIEPRTLLMDGDNTHYVNIKSNVPWKLYANKNMSSGAGTPNVEVVTSLNNDPLNSIPNPDDDFNHKGNLNAIISDGGYNLPMGTNVQVTTVDDIRNVEVPHIFTGYLGLYAESKNRPTVNDGKGILCASGIPQDEREANCYVINPESGAGILIPVRAANGVMVDKYNTFHNGAPLYGGGEAAKITSKINSLNPEYGAKLVWADDCGSTGKGLEEDGLLSLIIPVGKGENGHILVIPGNAKKEGNAVVAVTRNDAESDADKGNILWSWHIWLTKDMKFEDGKDMESRLMPGDNGKGPSTEYWLDRNLGALNNGGEGKTDIYTYGTLYQWGRKDPFLNANKLVVSDIRDDNERKIYDSEGLMEKSGDHGYFPTGGGVRTVENSLATPQTVHFSSIGSGPNMRNWLLPAVHTLWGVGYEGSSPSGSTVGINYGKSIFDPCPAGYRVPRRQGMAWDDPSNTTHWGNATIDSNMGYPTEFIERDKGIEWPGPLYKGGWYPTNGYRTKIGLFPDIGNRGFYWNASCVSEFGRTMTIRKGNVNTSQNNFRYNANAVRCVAE